MPNIPDLYNIQPKIEAACVYILSASAGITNVFTSRDEDNLTTPRVEVSYTNNDPNGHVYVSASKEYFYDEFNGQLNALIVTDRAWNESSHSYFVCKVTDILWRNNLFNTASLLPNHYVMRTRLGSTQTSIDGENNLDISIIPFNLTVAIRPESWSI